MRYKKINLELIVPEGEAVKVVEELDAALDQIDEHYTLFGGGIETELIDHLGMRRRSALSQTLASGRTASEAVGRAKKHVVSALHRVI